MEVVFVLDTTSSMRGMIAGAKQKIWSIASRLKSTEPKPEIRFGLVAFRDRGDAFVTTKHPLSDQLDDIYGALFGFRAEGGGDIPESVNEALRCAVQDLQWSTDPKVFRVIFLVGDAPPHMDYRDDVHYPESCRQAKARGILINTLQCGIDPQTESVWRSIAQSTGGRYAVLPQSGGAKAIETPHDAEIVRLTTALDATIIPYGTPAERANTARNRALLQRMAVEGVADRAAFLSKAETGAVLAGKGDLVLEVMSDRFPLDSLDPEKLEPVLRNMFAAERADFILRMIAERRRLHQQLLDVVGQRSDFLAEKMKSASAEGVLELSAFEILDAQAEKAGYGRASAKA